METTLRVFAAIGVMIVSFCIVGCGGDSETDSPAPTVEKEPEIKFGLDGDTYRNRRLFKVSNLPIDDWIVKEVNKTVEGENEEESHRLGPSALVTIYYKIHARGGLFLRPGI